MTHFFHLFSNISVAEMILELIQSETAEYCLKKNTTVYFICAICGATPVSLSRSRLYKTVLATLKVGDRSVVGLCLCNSCSLKHCTRQFGMQAQSKGHVTVLPQSEINRIWTAVFAMQVSYVPFREYFGAIHNSPTLVSPTPLFSGIAPRLFFFFFFHKGRFAY